MSCQNLASPLGLGWQNVTVSLDGRAVSRGIGLAVGSPPQIISLRPSVGDDNTFIFNSADCVTASNDSCIGVKGGVFDSTKSKSYVPSTQTAWNGSHTADIDEGNFIYFNDEIQFGSNGTALGFPLLMDQPGWGSQSGLGIGPASTFLDAVVANGFAPSRAWGLWPGSRSIDNPIDGALWIGGYDNARVEGDLTVFPNIDGCPTCVVVTEITYDWSGGSESLFSNSSETLQVALEPFARTLDVPVDIFNNFARISNGSFSTVSGQQALLTYPVDAILGNLTVTLQNGYTTVIPAAEIFLPPRTYDSYGEYSIENNTYLLAGLANTTVPAGIDMDWGIPFLTMNYMIVDYDKNEFKMAPALREVYGDSNGPLPVALCSGLASSTTTTSAPTSSPTKSPTPSPNPVVHHSHTGAIVGGVVGGIGGLALIAALLFFLFRSRRKERKLRAERDAAVAEGQMAHKDDRTSIFTGTSPTEVTELASPKQGSDIGQWLQTQDHGEVVASTITRPFEMPAHYE